jgi:hypothetical protein
MSNTVLTVSVDNDPPQTDCSGRQQKRFFHAIASHNTQYSNFNNTIVQRQVIAHRTGPTRPMIQRTTSSKAECVLPHVRRQNNRNGTTDNLQAIAALSSGDSVYNLYIMIGVNNVEECHNNVFTHPWCTGIWVF